MSVDNKIKCTVGILTFNSGASIRSALESVKRFAEIIVCDGGSTDETLPLARAYGAKVIVQAPEYKGEGNRISDFSGVRNQMLQAATHEWFFSLDSDEFMTEELADEIASLVSGGHPPAAFWVPRFYTLGGDIVRCAATYPTQQVRFFHRNAVKGFVKPIHERIEAKEGVPILSLKNFMLVPMNPDPLFHRRKWEGYVELEAKRLGRVSLWRWLCISAEHAKVSLLYLFRYVRNIFVCRGKRLPWKLERERHVYHWRLSRRLLRFF